VFLGASDIFTVSDSNATLFGSASGGTAKLTAGVSGVKTDANFTRIELSGNLTDYKLVGLAGTGLQIQNASGTVVDTIASLNNDITLAFANGSALLRQTGGSAFSLGGLSISTATPATVSATLNAADTSVFSTFASRFTTKSKIFMGQNDSITIVDSGATLIGNTSTTAKIASGVTGVKTDANFNRLELAGSLADYRLGAVAGVGLQIQNASGVTINTFSSLNNDLTLAFANGSALLRQTGGSAFSLGGVSISTGTPATVTTILNAADTSTLGTTTPNSTVNVSASGSSSAANGDLTFDIASGTYTYTINGFGPGDKLKLFSGASTSVVPDSNDTDGIQSIAFTNPVTAAITTITLTGLTSAQDAGIFNVASFNTVFGAGTLA
jgi:hypothetical protein